MNSESGGRTAPSAGATYPIVTYLVSGNVDGLPQAVYRYSPEEHSLTKLKEGDLRTKLSSAALSQTAVEDAAIDIVFSGVFERITPRYGERGVQYTYMEAGHAAQNICLQAIALNTGAVTIGAFNEEQVKEILGMEANETPLYILPAGRKEN